ncbi:MAG: hypothetical protein EOM17_04520, partial [Synergistales bacterium]|nr:hypothetical protein [Synergistales bacterium]
LYTRGDIDRGHLGIMGNSGGGTTSMFAGAVLDRITHVIASCSFSSFRGSIGAMSHCVCNYVPHLLEFGESADVVGLAAPKPVVIVNGRLDPIFPLAEANRQFARLEAIYRAAGTPGNCLSPEVVAAGEDWVLFGYGRTVDLMLRAREHARESAFLPLPTVVDLKCLKPLPVGELREMLTTHSFAIVAEDGYAEGGAGEAIAAFAESIRGEAPADVAVLGIPDIFVPQGKVCEQDEYCGLTPGNVVKIYAEHQKRAHRQAAPLEGAR